MKRDVPKQLWDYGMMYKFKLMKKYAGGPDGQRAIEETNGTMLDISEWCDFEFYDLVWYRPHGKLNERLKAELALWISILHHTGSNFCYWILPKLGIVQSHITVQHVTAEDYADESIKTRTENSSRVLRNGSMMRTTTLQSLI